MRDDAGETERLPNFGLGATVVRPVKGKSEFSGLCVAGSMGAEGAQP